MVFVWAAESVYHTLISGGKKRRNRNQYLLENFKPVHDELFEEELAVEGQMPPALNGVFLRIGPNPYFTPTGDYHWFDGDGMVHACRIRDGRVSYCNRFVRTSRLEQERAAGYPLFTKFGDMVGISALPMLMWGSVKKALGWINDEDGAGTANTALAYHAGRLLALHEGDLPYQLRVLCNGLVETLGRCTLEGKVDRSPFTAHPKVDPETGEMVFFGYNVDKSPHCVVGLMDAEGRVVKTVPMDLPDGGVMMHDCAITRDYVIILNTNLAFKPDAMVKQRTLPFVYDKSRPARFGLLRRDAADASGVRWFDAPACMIFHTANAWQEGPVVKMYACTFKEFDLDLSKPHAKAFPTEDHKQKLYEFSFDTESGATCVRLAADVCGDFPVVPATKTGLPTRYAYISEMDTTSAVAKFTGVVKVDLAARSAEQAVVGRLEHGKQRYGGEAYFVPSPSPQSEDDGFLITFVHDESAGSGEEGSTSLVVYDAASMDSRPVASVKLPARVPYGFHCLHVPEAALTGQQAALA